VKDLDRPLSGMELDALAGYIDLVDGGEIDDLDVA